LYPAVLAFAMSDATRSSVASRVFIPLSAT
jgi:hypothetical protein